MASAEEPSCVDLLILVHRTYHGIPDEPEGTAALPATAHTTAVFEVVPNRSALLVRVRSNVGPIEFGATGLTGTLEVSVRGERIEPIGARVELRVDTLTSGNALYDAELLRRVDARLFPIAVVELEHAEALEPVGRLRVRGPVTFHGVTRALSGVVDVTSVTDDQLTVSGEQVFDIRDFNVSSPTMMMLKIYPDVRVSLQVEAQRRW